MKATRSRVTSCLTGGRTTSSRSTASPIEISTRLCLVGDRPVWAKGVEPVRGWVRGKLDYHTTKRPGGQCRKEVLDLGDAVEGVVRQGHVRGLDLCGGFGPGQALVGGSSKGLRATEVA